jgi:hypothetical protein
MSEFATWKWTKKAVERANLRPEVDILSACSLCVPHQKKSIGRRYENEKVVDEPFVCIAPL